MKVARVALEVEQLMADYPSMVNSSKWLPKAKHHMEHIIETKCTHPVQAHYRRLDKDKLEAAKAEFSLSCVEESARLLKYQASLEEKRGKVTDYSYLSVDYIATHGLLFDLIN